MLTEKQNDGIYDMLKTVYPTKTLSKEFQLTHPDCRSINCGGHTAVVGHSAVGGNGVGSAGGVCCLRLTHGRKVVSATKDRAI